MPLRHGRATAQVLDAHRRGVNTPRAARLTEGSSRFAGARHRAFRRSVMSRPEALSASYGRARLRRYTSFGVVAMLAVACASTSPTPSPAPATTAATPAATSAPATPGATTAPATSGPTVAPAT